MMITTQLIVIKQHKQVFLSHNCHAVSAVIVVVVNAAAHQTNRLSSI
jgi:hypothetical protein